MDVVRRTDIVDQLGRIESPTLVAVGKLDPVTPVAAAEEIVGGLPDGLTQAEIIEAGGHFTWMDAPDRFWPMIVEFVRTTTRKRPTLSGRTTQTRAATTIIARTTTTARPSPRRP